MSEQESSTERKRVNIYLNSNLHRETRELAAERGESFCEFNRRALRQEYHRIESGGITGELRPVIEQLDIQSEELTEVAQRVDQMEDLLTELVDSVSGTESTSEIVDEVEQALDSEAPRSIPEVAEELSYPPERVQRAVEILHDCFVLEKTKPQEPETGVPRWRLR